MTDKPSRDMERSSMMFGMLATATSIGALIELSTSCTAKDGASAIT